MQLSPHFRLAEFASPIYAGPTGFKRAPERETPPLEVLPALRRLAAALEVIRAAAGGKPITIHSGWRSRDFNSRNKGRADQSRHLFGEAADMTAQGIAAAALYWIVRDLSIVARTIPRGGLAYYPATQRRKLAFVHYDTRGHVARWMPAPPRPR